MQRTFLMSGNGGQGIVVSSKLIGAAAAATGRHCLHFARYGSEIRGTECECSLTISDEKIRTPAIISRAWGAIAMHPQYFDHVLGMVEDGGILFFNSSLEGTPPSRPGVTVHGIPASDIATSLGGVIAASLVALGAFAEFTGLVNVEDLVKALDEYIPPYRHQLLDLDGRALREGARIGAELRSPTSMLVETT